jgi:hypothetical protein
MTANEPNFSSLVGVEFIDENGGAPGVRLRKPNETKSKKVMPPPRSRSERINARCLVED